jgi:putative addiction module component (TIGR02574 family)
MSYETILHEAEQLPIEEQRALVAELASHFPEEEDHLLTPEQHEELNRRLERLHDGTAKLSSWEEVRRRIEKRLG